MSLTTYERSELLEDLGAALPGLNVAAFQTLPDEALEDLAVNAAAMVEGQADELPDDDLAAVGAGQPVAAMGSRSRWTMASASAFGESIARERGGAERAKVEAFASANAAALRQVGKSPKDLVKLYDRMSYGKPPGSVPASLITGDDGPARYEHPPAVGTFAERRAHRLFERQRVERFCEQHHDTLKWMIIRSKDPKAAILATFDRMLETNPAATLEDLVGRSASANS